MYYDFTRFFSVLGYKIIQELKDKMLKQKGVDGAKYADIAQSTLKKKIMSNAKYPWMRMIDTTDFLYRGFQSEADKDSVTVFIPKVMHGRKLRSMTKTLEKYRAADARTKEGKKFIKQSVKVSKASKHAITFEKLAKYQNKEGKSLFFPVTVQQVNNLQSVQRAIHGFKREVIKQTREMFPELCKMKVYNI